MNSECLPIPASIIPQNASHELEGVLLLFDCDPICTVRTMAMTTQMIPMLNRVPIANFCDNGRRRIQISFSGRSMIIMSVRTSTAKEK